MWLIKNFQLTLEKIKINNINNKCKKNTINLFYKINYTVAIDKEIIINLIDWYISPIDKDKLNLLQKKEKHDHYQWYKK